MVDDGGGGFVDVEGSELGGESGGCFPEFFEACGKIAESGSGRHGRVTARAHELG